MSHYDELLKRLVSDELKEQQLLLENIAAQVAATRWLMAHHPERVTGYCTRLCTTLERLLPEGVQQDE